MAKSMKTAMATCPKKVSNTIKKHLSDAKAKAKAKAAPKATAKAKSQPKPEKATTLLTAKELAKVGTMSLDEKLVFMKGKLGKEPTIENFEECGDLLTKTEKSAMWGRHQTFLRNNPKAADDVPKDKKGKGFLTLAWNLDPKQGDLYSQVTNNITSARRVTKVDQWQPWKFFDDKFGPEEAANHFESGRIGWRIDPLTPGSNEYIDHGDIRITKEFVQTKGHEKKQELEMDDADDLDDFLMLVDKEIRVLCFVLY